MKKRLLSSSPTPAIGLALGWVFIILAAYSRLLLHPDIHLACPENDTWNLPVRWSVLSSLREGHIPLWNPLSAFGIPWLASWSTEVFYPGTLLFTWLGLNAWNYSGVLHLLIFSLGLYFLLRRFGVQPFGAFFSASLALLNGCAVNHLGSNSPMDTMAWIPWVFVGAHQALSNKPWGRFQLGVVLTLQTLAGYPQILFYTLLFLLAYAVISFRSVTKLILPTAAALLITICQWLPSVEYFLFQAVRLPAVKDNPEFVLPLNNLLTLVNFNALSQNNLPDYVASPTYFYFNFYSGLIPLAILFGALFQMKKWNPATWFWFISLLVTGLWIFGFISNGLHLFHLSTPSFLEPGKAWVLVNFIELVTLGLLWQILPSLGHWKWVVLGFSVLNLLIPIWFHPLEQNLLPNNPQLEQSTQKIEASMGSGRALVLADEKDSSKLYQPLPDPELKSKFKYFVPNSNLYTSIPLANAYSSTWPSTGVMNAELYFKYSFPYSKGHLLDLLGVDLLYLNETSMPKPLINIGTLDGWTMWKNPNSLGKAFIYRGDVSVAGRKDVFSAFASGISDPQTKLYLTQEAVTELPRHPLSPLNDPENHYDIPKNTWGYLVITQNALPGWKAWVDGKPAAIVMADWIFQSVQLPVGAQTADLRYEPTSFRFGLFISLLALTGLFFKAVTFLLKR